MFNEEDDFEVINSQELQNLATPDDNYDFLDRDLCFDDHLEEYDQTIPDEQPLRPFFFMRLI